MSGRIVYNLKLGAEHLIATNKHGGEYRFFSVTPEVALALIRRVERYERFIQDQLKEFQPLEFQRRAAEVLKEEP